MKKAYSLTISSVVLMFISGFTMAAPTNLKWMDEAPEKMDWQSAMSYCKSKGAKLPTEAQIQSEIVACGGTVTGEYHRDENTYNKAYHACIEGKGWDGDYWTSSLPTQSNTCAFDIYLRTGGTGCGTKDEQLRVRCVK